MDNGINFLFTGGVEFIPGNVFRIISIQQVDFEPPVEPGQRQSMVYYRCGKGFGKVRPYKPEGAGDKDIHTRSIV